ncbi:TPA: serine protease [Klebsiella quasipneumoniae subsp. quasipneumoniae]
MNEQWKKSVIHLECATDSESITEREKRTEELFESLNDGDISDDDFFQRLSLGTRDVRFHGTAIFISHKEKRYLLTARHVLFDELSAARDFENGIRNEKDQCKIFKIIFRVPSFDELLASGTSNSKTFLMNLGAGVHSNHPYTFSSPDIDLAIISLDQKNSDFADELIKLGYSPIPSYLIHDEPSSEGADVFTVGYPSSTALIFQLVQDSSLRCWSSSYQSLPIYSWGKVAMLNPNLSFYWCDMSIYPGNSGGPVIEDGKLVGIVSAQAVLPVDQAPQITTRIPFAKIIKTSFVNALIEEQEAKDQRRKELSAGL